MKSLNLQSLKMQYELLQMEINEIVVAYKSNIHRLIHTAKSCDEVMIEKMCWEGNEGIHSSF